MAVASALLALFAAPTGAGATNAPSSSPYTSCLAVLNAGASTGTGVYWLQQPGGSPYPAYCDMTTAGGGWTTIFADQNGQPNIIGNFDNDTSYPYVPVLTDPATRYLLRAPALPPSALLAVSCGPATVAFQVTPGIGGLLTNGTQARYQPLTPVFVTGSVTNLPNWMWTGDTGEPSFYFFHSAADPTSVSYDPFSDAAQTFASSFLAPDFDHCNSSVNLDTTSLVRISYREGSPEAPIATTTGLTSSANPVSFGSSVVLTAQVTPTSAAPATGSVIFASDGAQVASATLDSTGSAVATVAAAALGPGSHSLTAAYQGAGHFLASTSPALVETVTVPTSTTVSASRNPANQYQPVTFTARAVNGSTADVPTGSFTFLDGSTPIGSAAASGGAASVSIATLSAGSHLITAQFTGSGFFQSSSGTLTESILAPTPGYWLVSSAGQLFPFGGGANDGSPAGSIRPNAPIAAMASTPDGHGYWLVTADGAVSPFGNAAGYGSASGLRHNGRIVGMASTPDGHGYWLAAADGRVYPFGDASGYGAATVSPSHPIAAIAATPSGHGYWLVASDGAVLPFGDAPSLGSATGVRPNQPIAGIAATPSGSGYWLVASDGRVFSFGDAQDLGSTAGARHSSSIVGMAATPDGGGYWLAAADGEVFAFGNAGALGSADGVRHNDPVVAIAAPPRGVAALP